MKKFLSIILLVSFLTACDGYNEHGECIGITDEGDPNLIYKMDVWNTVWSFIAIETVIAPVLWATDYAKCPIGKKNDK